MMIKGRTLDQIVNEVSEAVPEATFYIGSTEGSGFFFIGNAEKYHSDIDTLSDKWRIYFEDRNAKKANAVNYMSKELGKMNPIEMADHVRNRWDSVISNFRDMKMYSDVLANWITIKDRVPKKIYKKEHVIDPNGLVILVPGAEDGGCWFEKDYDKLKAENFRRLKPLIDEKEDLDEKDS